MNYLRLFLPSVAFVAGHFVLAIVHWQDPVVCCAHALVLTGAIMGLLRARTRRR